ncbi:hypothetical protein BCR35DRAFT_311043 [Leucosporidium creatinivorum]|uniref:Uncharacterized protein n=1 Tax=Leucosporidium creatinivorum TaxID=106004 RepID=A0A1Y2CGQ2_9BASI|nr:hypothetical protein BCR35DRAFT_311043 [Leucosporidium creatinivorum]
MNRTLPVVFSCWSSSAASPKTLIAPSFPLLGRPPFPSFELWRQLWYRNGLTGPLSTPSQASITTNPVEQRRRGLGLRAKGRRGARSAKDGLRRGGGRASTVVRKLASLDCSF